MNDNKALEALERIETPNYTEKVFALKDDQSVEEAVKAIEKARAEDIALVRSALVELAEIKKRAEESRINIGDAKVLGYAVSTIIDFILKGEPK